MAAGPSKKKQAEMYAKLMGDDALARQTVVSRGKDTKVRCKCTQSSTKRAEEIGPYHKMSCPMYAPT